MKIDRRQQWLTRRGMLLTLFMTVPFTILLIRLYMLQVVAGQKYRRLSDENRFSLRLIIPERGVLRDRRNQPIAMNQRAFRLVLVPERCPDPKTVLARLGTLVRLDGGQQAVLLKRIRQNPSFLPVTVRDVLTFEEVARVQVNLPNLPGVDIDQNLVRNYPYGAMFAHTVGYIGAPDPKMLQESADPLLRLPDFRHGRKGLEQRFDPELRGRAGTLQVEVNAYGREVREVARVPEEKGQDVRLALDLELQRHIYDEMGEHTGGALVMDLKTGGLLAVVNKPGFEPNSFIRGLTGDEWRDLRVSTERPFLNRCLQGLYAPGSTFKMLVALAALEEGLAKPEEVIRCPGFMQFGNRRFHCWEDKGHGGMDLRQSIVHSCDIYYYELGRRLGVDRITAYAQRFGLGSTVPFELQNEGGLMPTREWKRKRFRQPWVGGEDLISAIGQGYLQTTPLQLLVMTARLATSQMMVPTLLPFAPQSSYDPVGFKESHLELIRRAMYDVVNTPGGTAYRSRSAEVKLAGKTGTSQVVSKRHDRKAKLESIVREERTNAMFVGFAPYDAPRVAVSVALEHAGHGSQSAAPLACDAMLFALKRLQEEETPSG